MTLTDRSYPSLHRLPLSGAVLDLPAPPANLTPDTFAGRLYGMLAPVAQNDPSAGWSLLILCNTIGVPYQLVEDWVRDTAAGPGWSLLLDVARCPSEALGWLGQFVGVRLRAGDNDDANRNRIQSTDGFRRGTLAAMQGAVYPTLTGQKRLFLKERDSTAAAPDYAYHLTAITYSNETPDPTATQNALLAQKPGGIVLTYIVQAGQSYDQLRTRFASYAAVVAAYTDYAALLADEP